MSDTTQGSRAWEAEAREISATFVSEVRPNPGNESATCSICGALLVCLSCGNHRDEATAHLAERVKELEQALTTVINQLNPCERMRGTENYACRWCYVFAPDPKRVRHSAGCAWNNARAALAKPAEPEEQK